MTTRYLDCVHDFEVQCWKLGIPIQTRHREVAPGQYEVSAIACRRMCLLHARMQQRRTSLAF